MNLKIAAIVLLLASLSFANGGNQKYVDGYLVQLSSLPISPFAGEKFSGLFSFANISRDLLPNVSGGIKINYGDRAVFNGNFSAPTGTTKFEYVFNGSGYYDLLMEFRVAGDNKTYVPDHFLIEVKQPLQQNTAIIAAVTFLIGIIAGFVFGWRIRK